jgi:hypothetical protein
VVALALSGAREATEQFRQLKSLAGGWATTNAWNSLLVYAAGTFDGLAPQRRTALVASNSVSCDGAKAQVARRKAKPAARRPARVKVETAEPLVAELALNFDEADSQRSDVDEFRIEVGRDAGAKVYVPRFAAADFETEVARGAGREAEAARAQLSSELSKLWGSDFVFKVTQSETLRGRSALKRRAPRRRVEERRDETSDAEAQDALFEAPSASGLLNCDDEPRR